MPVYIDTDEESTCGTNISSEHDQDQCSVTDNISCDSESYCDEDNESQQDSICYEDVSNNLIDTINKIHIVDIANIYNYKINNTANMDILYINLKKRNITFDIFKRLFFKKKCGSQYSFFKILFVNDLLHKLKPALLHKIIQTQNKLSYNDKMYSKKIISLHKEIWSLDIEKQIEKYDVLNYSECMKSLYSFDTNYVRVTLNLLVSSLSLIAKIEIIFNITEIPSNTDTNSLDMCIFEQ